MNKLYQLTGAIVPSRASLTWLSRGRLTLPSVAAGLVLILSPGVRGECNDAECYASPYYTTRMGVGALDDRGNFGSGGTAFGADALTSNTTGDFNTAIGWQTLKQTTTGNDNTASGSLALLFNTTGERQHGHRFLCALQQHHWAAKYSQWFLRALQQHHWKRQHGQRISGSLQ